MKLATRLESQLAKLFLISAGVGAVVLFSSVYISTSEIKNKAVNFISTHVKTITQAEINSQNVSDIDREVRRLYEAWRGTQDIDIRIEIFLDDKLVGKAGQLQKFGALSFSTSESHLLPSGQKLDVNIQLDLINQILTDVLMLAVFSVFLFGCYYLLKKSLGKTIQQVTTPLERRVEWLTDVAQKLPESIQGELLMENSTIDEVQALDVSLNAFAKQIIALESRVKEAGIKEGRVKMAEQLAHTVKGKLSLLQLRIDNSASLSLSEKQKLASAVSDVATAAQTLLKSGRSDQNLELKDVQPEVINIGELLKRVVTNRTETLPPEKQISIYFSVADIANMYVRGSSAHLEATFANVIDNAVEAITTNGDIRVSLKTENGFHKISIADSGCGIPDDILPQLMKERATFGKSDGNGLGLFHAKAAVDNLGGKIKITSAVDQGTEVLIELPLLAMSPIVPKQNFEIDLSSAEELVVLDDDQCIHAAVALLMGSAQSIKVINLYSIQEFETWMIKNGPGALNARVYWMDYDLKHSSENGISMIQKHGLQFEAYLVTGMAGSEDVQKIARAQSIRLFAKDDISKIQIKFNKTFRLPEIGLG